MITRSSIIVVVMLLASAGCTKDDVVSRDLGAACAGDGDCSSLCLPSSRWPNGFCTRLCASDADCSGGSVCVQTASDGAVCLVPCQVAADCSFLSGAGATWSCIDFAGGDAGGERACGAQ